MKTEINITRMEDIGRSEIQENLCCTVGLQEMGFKCLKHQPNGSKWRSQHPCCQVIFCKSLFDSGKKKDPGHQF